jgi:hypothetical protein
MEAKGGSSRDIDAPYADGSTFDWYRSARCGDAPLEKATKRAFMTAIDQNRNSLPYRIWLRKMGILLGLAAGFRRICAAARHASVLADEAGREGLGGIGLLDGRDVILDRSRGRGAGATHGPRS